MKFVKKLLDEEEKLKDTKLKPASNKMTKKKSKEAIKEEIKDGIEYKSFNVSNIDGELHIRFGIKCMQYNASI